MIVYVESNFILEFVYQQEQYRSVEQLLALAKSGQITLALPAFSIPEATLSLRSRADQRSRFIAGVNEQSREFGRREPHADLSKTLKLVSQALVESGAAEEQRFDSILDRVFEACQILPLTDTTIRGAMTSKIGLKLKDAIILESILNDLAFLRHFGSVLGSQTPVFVASAW